MRTPAFASALVLAFVAAFGSFAHAQDWPVRPVTLVMPYAAGGPNDSQARILAARLGELLRQQVIIENVGGAGGMTGAIPYRGTGPAMQDMIASRIDFSRPTTGTFTTVPGKGLE